MADTNITLAVSAAHVSGAVTVTASATLFVAADVGRHLSVLHKCNTQRVAATAYAAGQIFISEYNQVPRLYRVTKAGSTAAAVLAGTTPNYDLAAPKETGATILDGTATIKYLGPGSHAWGWGIITGFTSSTVVTVTVNPRAPFCATYASLRWRLGEFSDTRGWPVAGAFHKSRLWLGGTATRPQTLWATETADFSSMSPSEPDGTVLDTNAIAVSIDDDVVQTIRWLRSIPRGLALGAAQGEFLIAPTGRTGQLAPGNVTADPQGGRGSDLGLVPHRVSGPILFVQRGGRRLRVLDYDLGPDRFVTQDMTALADHIAGPGFVETAYSDTPEGIFWGLRADGKIAALTFDPDQKLRGWTLIAAGGDGIIESIAAVPDPAGTGSDLYCSVNRGGLRTMEFLRSPFRGDVEAAIDGFFVDCGLSYSGVPVTTLTGLPAALEGRRVFIVADGSWRDEQIVAAGSVPITGPAAGTVHVGLPYKTRIVDLPPEAGAPPGSTSQGMTKRVTKVTLRLLDSMGGSIGGLGDPAEEMAWRDVDMDMDAPVPLFTGDKEVNAFGSYGVNGQVEITTDAPFPFTLLAIIKEVTAS